MTNADMLDRLPHDPTWRHGRVAGSGGVMLHYVRPGRGDPVLVLHRWPGLWYDWRRVLVPLADVADVIAPDFRGFGDSDKPDLPPAEGNTPGVLADDLLALLDGLRGRESEAIVDAYAQSGAVKASIAYYRFAPRAGRPRRPPPRRNPRSASPR